MKIIGQSKNILIVCFLFILFFSKSGWGQEIHDLIQPINLTAGYTDSLLITDLFYAKNYNAKFYSSPKLNAKYLSKEKILALTPSKDFEGITLLKFSLGKNYYYIPVVSKELQFHLFTYKPNHNPASVNLFGSFNGWNRDNLKMKKNSAGIYEISIPLETGRHEYKFFVDGEEIIDPINPDSAANGIGGFNSILTINKKHEGKTYLHVLNFLHTNNTTKLSFMYQAEKQSKPLDVNNIIALLDNSKIPDRNIKLDGNKIEIILAKKYLKRNCTIRVAVDQNGNKTNIQTVRLYNGLPYGTGKHFSWEDAVIYSIMIDRFSDGDSSNSVPIVYPGLTKQANYQGGDLQGILDKINNGYFDSLGINTLWISPINDNTDHAFQESPPPHRYYTGYHGYWPISATRVEERFGNISLFKKLVSTAHKHGIKILLDYVAHHVHIEHPFWKEHKNWFGKLELPDGRKNLRMWDEYRLTTWFEPYLPSFDYVDSDSAVETMTDNAVWWLKETGIDGFRHDAVKHVPNKFWRRLTEKIKKEIEIPENKTIYQIGETFGSYDLVSSYVNNGQLDAQFNFILYDTALPVFLEKKNSFKLLDNQMQKSFSVYGNNNLMGNIMDSHDKVRYMAYADSDISLSSSNAAEIGWTNPPTVDHKSSYEKLKLYLTYLSTIPGIPVIYYGDEIGMTGAADPDNRRMMRYGNQLSNWEKGTLKDVRKIISLRKNNPALRYGDFLTLMADSACYVYMRSDMNERVMVALNKENYDVTINVHLPKFYNLKNGIDLLNNDKINVYKNSIKITLPPFGRRVFRMK